MRRSPLLPPLVAGALGAAAVLAVASHRVELRPGTPAWSRLLAGAGPAGTLAESAVVRLPGLDRREPAALTIEAEAASGGGAVTFGAALDGGPTQWTRAARGQPATVLVPASAPGARLRLRRATGVPAPRLLSLRMKPHRRVWPWAGATIAFAAAAGLAHRLRRPLGAAGAFAVALWAASTLALSYAPALLWLAVPEPAATARLAVPVLLAAAAAALVSRVSAPQRRAVAAASALAAAFVFGAWVRAFFLPSAGSWDTEYWKAWSARMAEHGITRVYGDPEPFDPSVFADRLRGRQPLWQAPVGARAFVVDYPPLGMALLHGSWAVVARAPHRLDGAEARNVAAKLPATLGDLAAVALLLAGFRDRPRRGLTLAALYWALPPAWLSSAVLGYTDGAYAPLSLAALWMAGSGRGAWAGALLAVAALIKPTALVAAPAAAAALWPARGALRRACTAGLAVVAAAMLPFLFAGTAALAVAQVFRIFFQKTFSGGFANLWWVVGHAVSSAGAWRAPVRFTRLTESGFPVAAAALVLFAAAAVAVARAQRRAGGPYAAALAGGALVLAYGLLAVGVHDNHPHAMVLLLLGSGLFTRRLQAVCAGIAVAYTANMLALSGLGRFYGTRYLLLEPWAGAEATFRMAPGFDATLLLATAHVLLFAALLTGLRDAIGAASRARAAAAPGGPSHARAII